MSDINLVIYKGNKKASFTTHYSYPQNFIQGKEEKKNLSKQLDFLLKHEGKGTFDPSPYDAGVIIFDANKRIIDNRNNGGFNAFNLDKFPQGWKIIEKGRIITANNFKEEKEKWNKSFNL